LKVVLQPTLLGDVKADAEVAEVLTRLARTCLTARHQPTPFLVRASDPRLQGIGPTLSYGALKVRDVLGRVLWMKELLPLEAFDLLESDPEVLPIGPIDELDATLSIGDPQDDGQAV
jgi:hypothetical protein